MLRCHAANALDSTSFWALPAAVIVFAGLQIFFVKNYMENRNGSSSGFASADSAHLIFEENQLKELKKKQKKKIEIQETQDSDSVIEQKTVSVLDQLVDAVKK